ncbi:MAG: hypothetical protein AAF530_19850 [Pseudomonadota bacterium]
MPNNKTPHKRSSTKNKGQNHFSEDKRIIALVRFLARRAAEKDYKELLEVLKSDPKYAKITSQEMEKKT